MNTNDIACKILNFIVAQRKASESTPLKLGNVEFWHEVPGFAESGLCYSIPVQKWDISAIQTNLNQEASSCWNDLMGFLGGQGINSLHNLYEAISSAYKVKNVELAEKLYETFYIPLIIAEGFDENQASAISYEAYERGHSAGILECVCVTFGLISFAKKILKSS